MTLSTGDILAIVFGSLLGIVILGYLIYSMMFRKKKVISIQDVEKYIQENPSSKNQIMNMLSSAPSSEQQTVQPQEYGDKILTDVNAINITENKLLKEQIINWIKQKKEYSGKIPFSKGKSELYSRYSQVKKLSDLLKKFL
mgnify:CR=1 FL=1